MFAGNQVDEMLAAGPMPTQYEFQTPVAKLLSELGKCPKRARVYVEKGDTRLELAG